MSKDSLIIFNPGGGVTHTWVRSDIYSAYWNTERVNFREELNLAKRRRNVDGITKRIN